MIDIWAGSELPDRPHRLSRFPAAATGAAGDPTQLRRGNGFSLAAKMQPSHLGGANPHNPSSTRRLWRLRTWSCGFDSGIKKADGSGALPCYRPCARRRDPLTRLYIRRVTNHSGPQALRPPFSATTSFPCWAELKGRSSSSSSHDISGRRDAAGRDAAGSEVLL